MKSPDEAITDFQGLVLDVAPVKMPPQFFQTDVGGDRTRRGSWKRRRGMKHTDSPKQGTPVTCITGFHMPFSHGYVIAGGLHPLGTTNLGIQDDSTNLVGRFLFDDADLSHEVLFFF